MVRTSSILRVSFVVALLCAGAAYAQNRPIRDVNSRISPNLASAQTFISDAWDKLNVSQVINNGDMNGHAANAKNLLVQASEEVSEAAKAAYSNQGK